MAVLDAAASAAPAGHPSGDSHLSRTDDELVTVVIPVRNEQHSIASCLESVRRQTYKHLQIIIVDGASEDSTVDILRGIAREDPRIEILSNPARIIPRSLNLALEAACGRWLVRVDAHCTIPSDYVELSVSHLRTGDYGGVGGRKDGVGVTPAGRAIAVAMGSRFGVGNSMYHHGEQPQFVDHIPFGCYPTDLARRLGGWDERLAVNQDFEFDRRVREAGYELFFDPALRIDWQCRQSISELFRQYQRYGDGKVAVMLIHPGSVRPRHLAPPMLVLTLLGGVAMVRRHPRVAGALLAPYALCVAIATACELRRLEEVRARAWLPLAFVAMHIGWGAGFWRSVIGRAARICTRRAG